MGKTVTISPNETIKVGETTFEYRANKGRGEIVVRVDGDGDITHIAKNGRERLLQRLETAALIHKMTIDNQ
jgi:hypothetical protein